MKYTLKMMELAEAIFGKARINELFKTRFPFALDENEFRGQVLAEACYVKEASLTKTIARNEATIAKYREKVETINDDYSRRIPPRYQDIEVKVRGRKVRVNELEYVISLENAITELETASTALRLTREDVKELALDLPSMDAGNVPARVVSRLVLRLKDSLKVEDVPAFSECVKACKLWHCHNADNVGRHNTLDPEYKRMKKGLEDFMEVFVLPENNAFGFKKTFINLNQKELVRLACNVFTGENIRNTKTADEYEFTITTEGRVKYEQELMGLLIMKWSGKRLA